MIRILLVDDQNLVQQGIKSLLDGEPELKVIGTVKDGRSAVAEIEYLRPDIVLLDIEMPGMDGITTTKYISRLCPRTNVIILSSHEDKKYVTQALMAGAKGYLLKDSLVSDLKQAILAVNNGYSQIDSKLLAKVFDPSNFKQKKRQSNTNQVEYNQNQTKSNHNKLIQEQIQARKTNSRETNLSVQSRQLADVQSQKIDSTSSPSGKYQLGASSVDPMESPRSTSKPKLAPESKPEIIKAEVSDSDVSERDTFILDNEHNYDLLELENSPKKSPEARLLNENSEAKIADRESLKQVVPDIEPNDWDDLPKRGYIESNRLSHADRVIDRQDSLVPQPSSEQLATTNTLTRVATKPTMPTPYPSNLAKYTSTKKRNKSKFQKLFKKSLEYSWVWNIILMVLGAVIVIILGNL